MDRQRKNRGILRAISGRGSLRFAELFESAANRSEVICTFLALLELIRLQPARLLATRNVRRN